MRLQSTLHTCNKFNAESIFCNTTLCLQSICDTIMPKSTDCKHFLQNHYQHQHVSANVEAELQPGVDLKEQNILMLWMWLQQ